jgi:hypothetical protein
VSRLERGARVLRDPARPALVEAGILRTMSDSETRHRREQVRRAVNAYRLAQEKHRPLEDQRATLEFDRVLEKAANASEHAFNVKIGENEPALLTVGPSGDTTLYRLRENLKVEILSYGKLRGGVLSQLASLADTDKAERGTVEVSHYAHPALEALGGSRSWESLRRSIESACGREEFRVVAAV